MFPSPARTCGLMLLGALTATWLVIIAHNQSLITDRVLCVSGLAKSRMSFVRDTGLFAPLASHTHCRSLCGKDTFMDPPS